MPSLALVSTIRIAVVSFLMAFPAHETVAAEVEGKKPDKLEIEAQSEFDIHDVEALTDGLVWKFHVAPVPGNAKSMAVSLWATSLGEKSMQLGSGIGGAFVPISADEGQPILIGILPVEGALKDTEKVRVVLRSGGVTTKTIVDNPLKPSPNSDSWTIARPSKLETEDGRNFHLLGFYESSRVRVPVSESADRLITLRIETESTQSAIPED